MFELTPFAPRFRNEARDIFSLMDAFDKDFFGDFYRGSRSHSGFRTDISDNGDSYLLESELPGFSKENIKIDVDGDFLTISASCCETNDDGKNFVHRERRCASYERSFNLSGIDTDGISAAYDNGILKVTLPKLKEETPAKKNIEIK